MAHADITFMGRIPADNEAPCLFPLTIDRKIRGGALLFSGPKSGGKGRRCEKGRAGAETRGPEVKSRKVRNGNLLYLRHK